VDDEIKRNCGASIAFPGIRRETSIGLWTDYGYWPDRSRIAPAKNGFVPSR